jgi:hypothetical protein
VDLFLSTDTIALHRAWMGMASFDQCLDEGQIELYGLADHVKAFSGWFKFSLFSDVKPVVRSD